MLRNGSTETAMFESLIPQHLWPFMGVVMVSSWGLGLSMVLCGKKKGGNMATASPGQSQSLAVSHMKEKSTLKPLSAASQPVNPAKTPKAEQKKSEKEKSEKKEEEKPAKEKSAKSNKKGGFGKSSMKKKKDTDGGEEKKEGEEEDNGYESCPDMTPEQLAKVVEENPK